MNIKTFLYRLAWKELGLSFSPILKTYVDTFLLTPQYRKGRTDYWDNPLLERGGVMDDLTTQRFYNYIEEEFLNFIVERYDYESSTIPLTRAPNGEATH